jgi:hypothetical protein
MQILARGKAQNEEDGSLCVGPLDAGEVKAKKHTPERSQDVSGSPALT